MLNVLVLILMNEVLMKVKYLNIGKCIAILKYVIVLFRATIENLKTGFTINLFIDGI